MQISSYFSDGNLAILVLMLSSPWILAHYSDVSDLISRPLRLKHASLVLVLTISQLNLNRGQFLFPVGNPSFAVDFLSLY